MPAPPWACPSAAEGSVDTTALNQLRKDFMKAPAEKWGAILCSIGAAITYLLLLVLLYFFVDLLVWQGRVPVFSQLTPAKQKEFEKEWAERSEDQRMEAVKRATASDPPPRRIAG